MEKHGNRKDPLLYRDIVDSSNTLIWRTDTGGRFTFLNPTWEKNYGYTEAEMLGRPFSDFQAPEASEYYINAFRNCLIGEAVAGQETTFTSKQGGEVEIIFNMIPIYDGEGFIRGTQGTAFDVTERKHADSLLQYISAKDELTGLYNLPTFLSMTEQQTRIAHRERKKMLIIYAGIDNMQMINNQFGHEKGDRILIDTADILRRTFREADILARTGGDEFVISTLVSTKETEDIILSRLQHNIHHYNGDTGGILVLSLSLGTSLFDPARPLPRNEVLSLADSRMHSHKKKKRPSS